MTFSKQIILGRDYAKPNMETTFPFNPTRVAGTTAGKKASLRKKMDGNEDAMCWCTSEKGELFAVADSHFGSMAADVAVQKLPDLMGPNLRSQIAAHLLIDDHIRNEKRRLGEAQVYPGCATTLMSCMVRGNTCEWVSSGDSRLFLIRDQRLIEINERHETLFLGDLYHYPMQLAGYLENQGITNVMTEQSGIYKALVILSEMEGLVRKRRGSPEEIKAFMEEVEAATETNFPHEIGVLSDPWFPLHLELFKTMPRWGHFTIRPGDRLCLASDGIEQDVSGLSSKQIGEILSEYDGLEKTAEQLLKKAMGRRGGNDNLSFILASF